MHIQDQGGRADEPIRLRQQEILNRIPSILENLPSIEQTWHVPQTAFAPRTCVGLVGLDLMRIATGDPTLVDNFSGSVDPRVLIQQAASNRAGVLRCNWVSASSGYEIADVVVLPGGVWAWDGISTPLSSIPSDQGVPAPIVGVGDAAVGVCTAWMECELNVLIDDSWVVITAGPTPTGIEALIPIANALVAAAAR